MTDIADILTDKDEKKAYDFTCAIISESAASDRFYSLLPDLEGLLDHKKSYVRTRAFLLCCAQARWDTERKLYQLLPRMLPLLNDEKPTVVRQALKALKEAVVFRPELRVEILNALDTMDLSGYKDSMTPLILKDMAELRNTIASLTCTSEERKPE